MSTQFPPKLPHSTRGAVKSLARPTSRIRRTESIVSLEIWVCSCTDLQDFSSYRGSKEACYEKRDFSNIETCVVINFFYKVWRPINFTPFWQEYEGKPSPIYTAVKKWVAMFIRGDFTTCVSLHTTRKKTMTTPCTVDQIQKLIFEDHRISSKSISEKMGISREQCGSSIHEDFNIQKIFAKSYRNAWTRIKKLSMPVV